MRRLTDGLPTEIRVLALLFGTATLALLTGVLFPVAEKPPLAVQIPFTVAGAAATLLIAVFGRHITRPLLHVIVAYATVAISVLVATAKTEQGLMASALIYVWVGIYCAQFFSPRSMRLHATFATVAFGIAMLCARPPTSVTIWVIVSATVWVAAGVLNDLSTRMRHQAQNDHLTGLLNRTGFVQAALRERAIAVRAGSDIALALIDLDDFKTVNDEGGHAAGDSLLADLAIAWRRSLRPGDLLGRYGGDEFILLLPDTPRATAGVILERLRVAHPGRWSAGLVMWEAGEALEAAISRCDQALYEAKSAGREPSTTL